MVATTPPSATATPISATVPCTVVSCSSTMECPAAWAAAGTAFCGPARVVNGARGDGVGGRALERALRGGGEQHDHPGDDRHDGADTDEDHDRAAVGVAPAGR